MSKHIPIDKKSAAATAKLLHPILLDLLELKTHVKQAHWNLRDANFISVHRLLDEVAEAVDNHSDAIAERIRQLGVVVSASSAEFSKSNRLPEFPSGELNSTSAITAVCASIQATVAGIREGISASEEKVDEPITADILTGMSGELEVQLWLLDSHLA